MYSIKSSCHVWGLLQKQGRGLYLMPCYLEWHRSLPFNVLYSGLFRSEFLFFFILFFILFYFILFFYFCPFTNATVFVRLKFIQTRFVSLKYAEKKHLPSTNLGKWTLEWNGRNKIVQCIQYNPHIFSIIDLNERLMFSQFL